METANQEFMDFIGQLQDWHAGQVVQLRLITENRAVDLKFGEREIEAGSDIAKGIRLGILIALDRLGELPFSVEPREVMEE